MYKLILPLILFALLVQSRSAWAAPSATPEQILTDIPAEIGVYNNYIYWLNCSVSFDTGWTMNFSRARFTGAFEVELWSYTGSGSQCPWRDFQLTAHGIYYINDANETIEYRAFDWNNSDTFVVMVGFANQFEMPNDLTIFGEDLYWAARDNKIGRWLTAGGADKSYITTTSEPTTIAVSGAYLWYGSDQGLWRVATDCASPCSQPGSTTGFAIANVVAAEGSPDSAFYAVDQSEPLILSYECDLPSVPGCQVKVIYEATSATGVVEDMAVSPTHVFWIENDYTAGRRIRRAPREGGGPVELLADISEALIVAASDRKLASTDTDLYFRYNGVSTIPLDVDPIEWEFLYKGIEVTQGIQSLTNDVPLIAHKPTYARVYGELMRGPDIGLVDAHIVAYRGDHQLPESPLQPLSLAADFAAGVPYDRNSLRDSWLFELPPSWTEPGQITLYITIDPDQIYDQTLHSSPKTITFNEKSPICIVGLRTRTHAPRPSTNHAGWGYLIETAQQLLPTAEIWRYKQGGLLEEGIWPFYSPYELPEDKTKILQNVWWHDQFSNDPDECDDAGAPTLYVALLHPETSGGGFGRAYVDGDQSWVKLPFTDGNWGAQNRGWPMAANESVLAHELGHNLGRKHVDCGGPDGIDGNYPYANDEGEDCWIGIPNRGTATYFGFEAWKQRPIAPDAAADIMSYGYPVWTSDYTWQAIYNRLGNGRADRAVDSRPTGQTPNHTHNMAGELARSSGSSWVMVSGTVDESGRSGALDHAVVHSGQFGEPADAVTRATSYFIRFVDAGNVILATHPIELTEALDHSGHAGGDLFFGVSLPHPGTAIDKVQLIGGSSILDTIDVDAAFVAPRISKPADGELIAGNQLPIAWSAPDSGGDLPYFNLLYSHDGGQTYRMIATGIIGVADGQQYEIVVDATNLPGNDPDQARIQLITSDGINTHYTTQSFTFAKQPPSVTIDTLDGAWFEAGKSVVLSGSGFDPEDGRLTGSDLIWTIDGLSVGTGERLPVDGLAPGSHSVTLWAADSDRQEATDTITIHIAGVNTAPGSARLDGLCSDLAYANGTQLQLPQDGGIVTFARNDTDFWVCFAGLAKSDPADQSEARLHLDLGNPGGAWPEVDDFGFRVEQTGVQKVYTGDDHIFDDAGLTLHNTLASAVTDHGATWSAEMRIDLDYYGSWNDVFKLYVAHQMGSCRSCTLQWPSAADGDVPSSWAAANLHPAPWLDTINIDELTLPAPGELYIEVSGANLQDGDLILWDGVPIGGAIQEDGTLGTYVNSEMLTPGAHDVTVQSGQSPDISSNGLGFTIYNAPPTLTSLTPSSVDEGAGSRSLTVAGTNFKSGAVAYWNGEPLTTFYLSPTTLRVTIPAANMAIAGSFGIVVRNPEPTQQVSNMLPFYVNDVGVPTSVTLDQATTGPRPLPALIFALLLSLPLLVASRRAR